MSSYIQINRSPPVVDGLADLNPFIRRNADAVQFLDINTASRSAVSFGGKVRALPLDTDYVASGWRQDVFHKHGIDLSPPRTIEELADLSEQFNGLDHNGDGELDWGVCLTPQVNYFYAFVAPVLQTQTQDSETKLKTGQNVFFDVETFEPLVRVPGFRYALKQYWRVIRSSNCQGQLAQGQKCDRKTAFPTGRCAMVISMPGTLTSMIWNKGSRAPKNRYDNSTIVWSISEQPLGHNGRYWGRRAPFPGSTMVQSWDRTKGRPLVPCDSHSCPLADSNGVNYAPFFAEGGEAYSLNGHSKSSSQTVMWDVFAWFAELPATKLPLSGHYRKSHLSDKTRDQLVGEEGWPNQMVDDLFELLGKYFKSEDDGGKSVQDLLVIGFHEYMGALDEELHANLFGVTVDSDGGIFDKTDPSMSLDPNKDSVLFDNAVDQFLEALVQRYDAISRSLPGGALGELQRWRKSLNLPIWTDSELCSIAISLDASAFRNLGCVSVVNMILLCQAQPEDVTKYDPEICQYLSGSSSFFFLSSAIAIGFVSMAVLAGFVYVRRQKRVRNSIWMIDADELVFDDPPEVIGKGHFGFVTLAEYRGTTCAVKRASPSSCRADPASQIHEVVSGGQRAFTTDFSTSKLWSLGDAFDEEMRWVLPCRMFVVSSSG